MSHVTFVREVVVGAPDALRGDRYTLVWPDDTPVLSAPTRPRFHDFRWTSSPGGLITARLQVDFALAPRDANPDALVFLAVDRFVGFRQGTREELWSTANVSPRTFPGSVVLPFTWDGRTTWGADFAGFEIGHFYRFNAALRSGDVLGTPSAYGTHTFRSSDVR